MLHIHVYSQLQSKTGWCVPNDLAVDSAGDAVLQLQVHLGDGIVGENGGVRDITCVQGLGSAALSAFIFHHVQFMRPVVRTASRKSRNFHPPNPVLNHLNGALRTWLQWYRIDKGSNVRMAADSTMLRMVNLLIALSLGVQRAQLEQRTGLTWPRPFLLRPL